MTVLAGCRVVVTGSSRGLGRGIALAMAEAGARVVLNGTQGAALAESESLVAASGAEVRAVQGSVAEPAVARALVATCVEAWGGIDVLVNNAGLVRDRTLFKMSVEEFDEVVAVHLRGSFLCGQQAALAMREGGGHIIQVVSSSGLCGAFGQSNYAAAKAGMMGLTYTWAIELARHGIRSNAFWPIADTDMTGVLVERARDDALRRGVAPPSAADLGLGSPAEVAVGAVWLASAGAAHLNGQCLTFNGRKTALWSHPQEVHETFRAAPWTLADLDAHYGTMSPPSHYQPRFVE